MTDQRPSQEKSRPDTWLGRICTQRQRWLYWPLALITPVFMLLMASGKVDHCAQDARFCKMTSLTLVECTDTTCDIPVLNAAIKDDPLLEQGKSELPAQPPSAQGKLRSTKFQRTVVPLPLALGTASVQRDFVLPQGKSMLDMATEVSRIDLARIALIAVVNQKGVRHALVRLPDGRILRLQHGDNLDGGTVAAIGDDTLYLLEHDMSSRAVLLGG